MTINDGYTYRHVLDRRAAGHSTLSYLTRRFPHSTEPKWQSRLDMGEVLLDGKAAAGGESLKPGSVLLWNRPGWVEEDVPRSYGIIHCDEHLLMVDKPGGLPTLPGGGFYHNTLLSLVQNDFPEARPLHRLGRATSGLVLFARDPQTAATLSRQWRAVRKQYRALSRGIAAQNEYEIRVPIGPQPHPRLGQVHAASPDGKPAHSVARVLERRQDTTLLEVDLLTGRPHQIRIHLATIGHPLEGDPLYTDGGLPRTDAPGLPGDAGYWLHARQLQFTHPATGEELERLAPPPGILQLKDEG